jgi:hypothetical protein
MGLSSSLWRDILPTLLSGREWDKVVLKLVLMRVLSVALVGLDTLVLGINRILQGGWMRNGLSMIGYWVRG